MDTTARLRAGPFHCETLSQEETIAKAEAELRHSESKPRPGPDRKDKPSGRYHPYQSAKPREDTGASRSDWRRFGKKKGYNNPKVKSQVTKPAKATQQRK